jgi:putative toxin-antitoxin system antitoxin component (TIGR02293 family)
MPTRRKAPTPTARRTPEPGASGSLPAQEPRGPYPSMRPPHAGHRPIGYRHAQGVDDFVRHVAAATPAELVRTERSGVPAAFVKDLAVKLDIPVSHLYAMIGLPKATAERKAAAGELIAGGPGQAALALARLLGMAQALVADSTAADAPGFDTGAWLGRWLQRPQPALGGLAPADFTDTPTGQQVVARLLGAAESGAYQ